MTVFCGGICFQQMNTLKVNVEPKWVRFYMNSFIDEAFDELIHSFNVFELVGPTFTNQDSALGCACFLLVGLAQVRDGYGRAGHDRRLSRTEFIDCHVACMLCKVATCHQGKRVPDLSCSLTNKVIVTSGVKLTEASWSLGEMLHQFRGFVLYRLKPLGS